MAQNLGGFEVSGLEEGDNTSEFNPSGAGVDLLIRPAARRLGY